MTPPVVDEGALLPCPFCNSAAKIWKTPNYYGVECTAKTFACVSMPACFESEQTAIEAWNTRAPHAALKRCVEALEGVIRIADRKTVEFDAARKTLAELKEIL